MGRKLADAKIHQELIFHEVLRERQRETFSLTHVTEKELLDVIKGLNYSSPDNDGLPMKIIKEVAKILLLVLLQICNSSFKSGIFPDQQKIAKVTPIYIKLKIKENSRNKGECQY